MSSNVPLPLTFVAYYGGDVFTLCLRDALDLHESQVIENRKIFLDNIVTV